MHELLSTDILLPLSNKDKKMTQINVVRKRDKNICNEETKIVTFIL